MKTDPAVYWKRLDEELNIIKSMGFAGYFLVVWDFINYAKDRDIPVGPGSGSAAGSLVAYSLEITDIDPLPYGLLFERFLNPERISMPDIDIDFCMDRRDEVISYVRDKYGADHVSQIITFGTMLAKGVIRDVGRVLDIPYGEVDKVAKLVPDTLKITLDDALAQEPRLRDLVKEDARIAEIFEIAKSLEGLTRHASKHAAGVVISEEPLTDYTPLYSDADGVIVTQYAKDEIEKIGLVKFDFLGLRTLTVIDNAVKIINRDMPQGEAPFKLTSLSLDDPDPDTYKLLASGDTGGVFQLESSGMRDLIIKMKPERFEDLIALVALYRPGPLQSGMVDDFIQRQAGARSRRSTTCPQLEEILKEHVRRHSLPGAGHADRRDARGLHPRPGGYAQEGHGQEEAGGHGEAEGAVHARRGGRAKIPLEEGGSRVRDTWRSSRSTGSTSPTPPPTPSSRTRPRT